MRMANHGAQTAGHPRAHSRRADIDHHRNLESIDSFPKRVQLAVVDRKMTHDRMKVKSEKLELFDRSLRFLDRLPALEWIDGRPCLTDHAGIAITHRGDVFIRARRRAGNRFDIEGNEHRLHTGSFELLHHLRFALPRPGAIPIFCQCFDVGSRSEEHTSELQSRVDISYAVFCLKKKQTSY